ncbi:uncharacterized protein LOC130014781 [Mercurialis annua]|uniref:uncharacterized protein LOC130014781 n=1 Tax=Mercurialis annua TaxID=3986 RepID=UPI0024AE2427|nr:uncharacterized protein LOC130014781 [Mercurialis annua]
MVTPRSTQKRKRRQENNDETQRKKRKTTKDQEHMMQQENQESATEQHVQDQTLQVQDRIHVKEQEVQEQQVQEQIHGAEQEVQDRGRIQLNEVTDNAILTETTRTASEREMLLSEVKSLLSHFKDTKKEEEEADSGRCFQKAKNWVDLIGALVRIAEKMCELIKAIHDIRGAN